MGSPFDEHFASLFYGEIEVTASGEHTFSMLCSDGCQLRIRYKSEYSVGDWRNRIVSISGPNAPREKTANPINLTVGFYEILVSHGAGVNDTGSDANLLDNLGIACVLFWTTPQLVLEPNVKVMCAE